MWPFKTEKRAAVDGAGNYTDDVVNRIVRTAQGSLIDPNDLASVQAGIGLIQRTFEGADYAGDQRAIDSIKPFLSWLVGCLVLRGEAYLYINDNGDLVPATLSQVKGEPGGSPVYKLILISPSGHTETISAAASSTLAFISRPGRNPWRGVSPIGQAGLSGQAAAFLERGFELIAKQIPVSIIGVPDKLSLQQADGIAEVISKAARDGVPAVFGSENSTNPTIVSSATQGSQTAGADLRQTLAGELSALIGVPYPLIYSGSTGGAVVRESLRIFHRLTLRPLATVIQNEVKRKTELSIAITFSNASVVDHQAQGRALKSYIDAGLTMEQAAHILGIELQEKPDGAN